MEFVENGVFRFAFSFKLEECRNMQGIAVIIGTVLGVILLVILLVLAQKDNSLKQNYDERQELLRGKGASTAYIPYFSWI